MSESECATPRPLSKLTVTIESVPRPEKSTGRRIVLHEATGRSKRRPVRTSWNFHVGTQPAGAPASCGCRIAPGAEEITTRALVPL